MRWRINDIPPDIRKRARDAAKAAGLPLGPWLERAIRQDLTRTEALTPVSTAALADEPATAAPPSIVVNETATAPQATADAPPPIPAEPSPDLPAPPRTPTRLADVIVALSIAISVVVASWLWLPIKTPSPQQREVARQQTAPVNRPAANDTRRTTPAPSTTVTRQEPSRDRPSPPPSRERPTPDAGPSPAPPRPVSPPPPSGSLPLPQIMAELQRQALNGDAMAQHDLGLAYVNGRGVPQNYQIAASWFEKAKKFF